MGAIEGVGTSLAIGSTTLRYVSLQGLGIDSGEKLDAIYLDNVEWKTYLPQKLKETPDQSFTAEFEPDEWDAINAEVRENQLITISYNYDGTSLGSISFWGFLKDFVPEQGTVGERWTATGTIVATHLNASGDETGPVYTA